MSDFQEARKQEARKSVQPQAPVEIIEENITIASHPCPKCGVAVPEGAVFCPECGLNLKAPSFCPNCGAKIAEEADICESCKAWLLDDQCKFCYTLMEKDATFCAECGNPRDGIKCPDCGNLSIFDFCTKCGRPLTEGAVKALAFAKTDPDAKALVDSIQETVSIEAELQKLEELINASPPEINVPTPPQNIGPAVPAQVKKMGRFSESKMAAILKTDKNMDGAALRRAEEQKKAEDHAKKLEDERQQEESQRLQRVHEKEVNEARARHEKEVSEARARKEALERDKVKALAAAAEAKEKLRKKTFLTHQEARCFHNARRPSNPRGWLCNYADYLHDDGPNGCYKPCLGGQWV
ncbi:MAG: zinc ribbon domain-containing protein [Treponema sp.]|nr:zinc ribbon domain-containing protein [Treponema sp.]